VIFHDAKQCLGLEDPQNQATQAVRWTAPTALLVYALVLLWYARRAQDGCPADWLARPWYGRKAAPSFADMLTALRRDAWRAYVYAPPGRRQRLKNAAFTWPDAVLATA
jgi:hypothetical protein